MAASLAQYSLADMIGRHPFAAGLPVIFTVCIALAIGVTRAPVYEAGIRMGVVLTAVEPSALAGYGTGTEQLAQTYARALLAPQIRAAVSRETGVPAATLDRRVFTTAVPRTPVFRITALASSGPAAVELAIATGRALVSYVEEVNSATGRSRELLKSYREAQEQRETGLLRRRAATSAYRRGRSAARLRELAAAGADVQVANQRIDALDDAYRESTRSDGVEPVVKVLSSPTSATSDRSSRLQILGFLGLVVGLLTGFALALVLITRDARTATI